MHSCATTEMPDTRANDKIELSPLPLKDAKAVKDRINTVLTR